MKNYTEVNLILDYTVSEPKSEYLEALRNKEIIEGELQIITGVPEGTAKGKPTVGFIIKLPDGRYVWAETTLKIFQTCSTGLTAKYGVITDEI